MPFQRPTLAQIVSQQEADFYIELQGENPFPPADKMVLSRTVGGVAHGLYGYIEYKARQANPATADNPEDVERHAAWWGVYRKQATCARGKALIPAGVAGTVVPAGSVVQAEYSRTSMKFVVCTSVEVSDSESVEVEIIAKEAGAQGNIPGGTSLRLVKSIAGVTGTWKVAPDGLALGTDLEPVSRLAQRLAHRVQEPPQGGALHDYRDWALAVPGVTRAWAQANWVGRGTVGILIVNDDVPGLEPGADLISMVQAYVSHPDRLPPGAEPFVLAPTFKAIHFRIAGLMPALPEVKQAVEENLQRLIRAEAEPGALFLISHIREAISQATGEHDHVLLAPLGNIAHEKHEMPIYGGVEWVVD